jgi:hypothetical protein
MLKNLASANSSEGRSVRAGAWACFGARISAGAVVSARSGSGVAASTVVSGFLLSGISARATVVGAVVSGGADLVAAALVAGISAGVEARLSVDQISAADNNALAAVCADPLRASDELLIQRNQNYVSYPSARIQVLRVFASVATSCEQDMFFLW